MIPGITEVNFPAYATLHEATISIEEMGGRVITTQVKIDGDVVPDFASTEWSLRYEGELFKLNTHTPQARKDTTTRCSLIDLTFESFPIAELKRFFFVELSEVQVGTMIVDKYIASLRLNAANFITAFNRVLAYYFDDLFEIRIASGTTLSDEVKDVSIEYSYLWDVLPSLYDVYGLVWSLSESNGKYIITAGNTVDAIPDHVFQYGFNGGLTRIERQLQDADIYNQLLGRGGEKNIPYRYFKKTDPNNEIWAADPDACAELENVYFERLMDINFRYYIKGWLRNPNRPYNADYPVPSTPEPAEIQSHWAYQKGLTDEVFNPVEYVQDLDSIAEYGIRQGKLDDNDDIFPTIQGITISPYGRIDEIVAVGPITNGDDGGVSSVTNLSNTTETHTFAAGQNIGTLTLTSDEFQVPSDRKGEVRFEWYLGEDTSGQEYPNYAHASSINTDFSRVVAIRSEDNAEFPLASLPGGYTYRLYLSIVMNKFPSSQSTTREIGIKNVQLFSSLPSTADEDNPYTFRVWVKNIWQTTKGANETDLEYMKRVWEPILGDRLGNEAKIVFSDGWMAASSDYEFTIVDWPKFDQSKSRNGVNSEWMLTLAKSDAEMDSIGTYIPSATSPKPVAGDHFFFIGIDMPHYYVLWAEKELNRTKQEAMNAKAYTNPTWAVELDPVRINTLLNDEAETLMSQLKVGRAMTIYDPRFTNGETLTLAIRSMTIRWNEGIAMYPSVEVVLSENVLSRSYVGTRMSPEAIVAMVSSGISRMGGEIMAATQKSYVSKEHDDVAVGNIQLAAGASFGEFNEGLNGEGGNIEPSGHAEFDSLTLRKWLEVPELRYNRIDVQIGNYWRAPGGGILQSVYPDHDSNGNMLNTGTAYLKLEEGEIGTIAIDDICMGIFHDGINDNNNALLDSDDSKGNFHFSGFYTTYFRVTEIITADNSSFRYAIRPTSQSWTQTFHPCAQMHFVAYGNFSNTSRQTSRYSTRTYERYLKAVTTWEFSTYNVAAQFGDLSNLSEFGLDMTGYSAYLENIYMSGHIKQVELPLHIEVDWTGQNMLASGNTTEMTFNVMQGFDNKNADVASWSIERDSGDISADATWNASTKAQNFDGTIELAYTDLGNSGISTLFTVTAVMDDENHTEVQYGFTLLKTQDASNVVMLDLDNENDSMLYTKEGRLLSGSVTSNAILKVGNDEITTGVTFSISASTGITASISGNEVTVSAMGAVSSGHVSVSATYGGRTYTKQLNLTKLVGDVKYDLFITPDSIGYNTTTGNITTQNIVVKVYRTGQDSNGEVVQEVASSLPAGWALKVDGTAVTYPGSAGYTIPINATALTGRDQYIISLVRANNTIADEETIPVNTVTNGTDGSNGSDGRGISNTEIKYARSSSGTAAPSSGWQDGVPTATTTYPFIWTRTTITYTSGDPSVSYSVSRRGTDGSDGSQGPQGPQGPSGPAAIHLDLDNENASFLYNADGTLISSSVTSTATLYSGGSPVTSGVTWAISERSGCTSTQATISGGVVTITGINEAGYVIVRATYGGVYYYAKLYLIKIIGDVKYDLLVSPNAVACNTTTQAKSADTINVKIYATKQTSSGMSRTLMTSIPSGHTLKVDNSTVSSSSYSSSGYSFNVDTSKASHVVTLLNGQIIADEETIPINKSANGAQGDLGPALVYRGDWSKLSSTTYFYSDAQRVDVVKYNSNYYKCKQNHTRSTTSSKTPGYNEGDSDYWKDFGSSFTSVATGLLLSEQAYIEYLGAYGLRILDANGGVVGGAEAATQSDPITFWLGANASNKSNAPFRITGSGGVTATSGTIGGLTVDGSTMKFIGSGTTVVGGMSTATADSGDNSISLWLGSNTKSTSAPFYVTKAGKLKATGADISGKITSSEGTIGGLEIGTDSLSYSDKLQIWASSSLGLITKDVQNTFNVDSASSTRTPLGVSHANANALVASFAGGTFELASGLRLYPKTTSASTYVMTLEDLLIINTAGGATLNPPLTSASGTGKMYIIFNGASSDITIARSTASTFNVYLNGSASTTTSIPVGQHRWVVLISVGTNTWVAYRS